MAFAVRSVLLSNHIIWNPVRTAKLLFSTNYQKCLQSKQNWKRLKHPSEEHQSWEERLADVTTPLWRLNYEEQLEVKQRNQERILSQLCGHLVGDFKSMKGKPNFPVSRIQPSPVQNGYRNKSSFSVNKGIDGNPKTVGNYVGLARKNNIVCVNGDSLIIMPEKHKLVARCYQDFLRLSPLDPCLLFHTGGHWREITVRSNVQGQTMAIVYFHPQTLSPEEVNEHKAALVDFFISGPGSVCQLDSLFFQESTMVRCSHEESPYQLLHGVPYIYEKVLGFKFRISPDAFFQVNQAAAEVLYSTIRDLCVPNIPNDTKGTQTGGTLLDVCCGTGAIGIIVSPRVDKIIGLELVEQAVEDAKHNADLNHVHNCQFIAGKAEVVLPGLMEDLSRVDSGVTAVVNPARAGLHPRVVRALRNHPGIRRLVFVSCKPEGEAMRNFRELCCAPNPHKKLTGKAFTPTQAVPVDMFPHTPHCELVLLFER